MSLIISSMVISRRFHINMANQIVSTVPVIFVTLLCFLVGKLVLEQIITHNLFLIIAQALAISVLYLLLSNILHIKAYKELLDLAEEYIPVKLRRFFIRKR